MARLKAWLPALVLAAIFLLSVAMCARAEVGSIVAYLHPRAFTPERGFILLLVFFDTSGCAMGTIEVPASAFDEKLRLARERAGT